MDPEAEADFDREFAKLMAESLDSRKFDRKPLFDVPLPMRRAQKDIPMAGDESPVEGTSTPPNPNTMAFSLMTKKGNKQQVNLASKLLFCLLFTQFCNRPNQSNYRQTLILQSPCDRKGRLNAQSSSASRTLS